MPTLDIRADRSSLLMRDISSGLDSGSGGDHHIPLAESYQGKRQRGCIDFPVHGSTWDGMGSVTKIELGMTSTGSGVHLAPGSGAHATAKRITSSWKDNSSGEGSTSTNPVVYPGPPSTSTDQVDMAMSTAGSETTYLRDITRLALPWLPTRLGGKGSSCYGVILVQGSSSSDQCEIHSARAANASQRPFLRITYQPTSANVPQPPGLIDPIGHSTGARYTLSSSTPASSYDIQVTSDPKFLTITHWSIASALVGLAVDGLSVDVAYGGLPYGVAGSILHWRARVRNASGVGSWSAPISFTYDPTAAPADAYTRWAESILGQLADPRRQTRLGQLVPYGEQVSQLLTTDYRDQWRVVSALWGPSIDRLVELVGMSVSASADAGWSVNATTHDLLDIPPED
jgi:hypothetical protein